MEICLVGASHHTTPIEVRERLAFSPQQVPAALKGIHGLPSIRECLIISTCNRTEVVAVIKKEGTGIREIGEYLLDFHKLDARDLPQGFYHHLGIDAARHLFRVTSSLESMVVGEPQILGQVKDAIQCAQETGTVGPLLNNLMNQALRVAKKVRTETGIAQNAVSVSFAAVELARKIFGELADKVVLLIGAGEMSELAARHLIGNGVTTILVANRTMSRAQELARLFGGEPVPFDRINETLDQADIVITSTGAPHLILTRSDITAALHRRKNRPMFLIDIAVPRDIDPEANKCDNVYLYDIDDLQMVVEANIKERQKEAKRASEIIDQELERFAKECALTKAVPTISQLSTRMEEIRARELQKAFSRLSGLENGQREVLDAMTRAMIKKILHHPIARLKGAENPKDLDALINAARELFGLKD
ncbi:MAG: glutamyl-tRNA reductase [bacterium]